MEEDKEDALSYHIEKLAIAFALVASPDEFPYKNFEDPSCL